MRRICAQCAKPIIAGGTASSAPVSHGLCVPCAGRLLREALLPAPGTFAPEVDAILTSLIEFWLTFVDRFHAWLALTEAVDHPLSQQIQLIRERLLASTAPDVRGDVALARILAASVVGQASALRLAHAVATDPRLDAAQRAALLDDLESQARQAAKAISALDQQAASTND